MSKVQPTSPAFPPSALPSSALPASRLRPRRRTWRTTLSALFLALALVGLPVAASYLPNGLGDSFVQSAQAGGCQGGSCGRIGPRP